MVGAHTLMLHRGLGAISRQMRENCEKGTKDKKFKQLKRVKKKGLSDLMNNSTNVLNACCVSGNEK